MSLWGRPMQIQRRGNFFNDTSFEGDRRYFETAANDLLKEFNFGGKDDSFTSYRRLRDKQLSGTDRTAKLAEEDDKFKIVMDVEGFGDADLKVQVLGPNSICIEGTQELKIGDTMTMKSFRRRFSLPNLAMVEDASSSISSDNVLTVNIPKKIVEIKDTKEKESKTVDQISHHVENLQEEIDKSFRDLKKCSFFEKSKLDQDTKIEESSKLNQRFKLPIVAKENFFDDSFFKNDRCHFQKSIQDILDRRVSRIDSQTDVFSKIREAKQEDVQAISVSDEEQQHKIVVDVHGYNGEDLKVNAVSEHEITIEGCTQKSSKYTNCCNSFRRNFVLPTNVNIREATSAISSDGILTILIPKNKVIPSNFSIPVLMEGGVSQTKSVSDNIQTTQVIKTEQSSPATLNQTTSENIRKEELVEQVVHSKVFGTNNQQIVGTKEEQVIPIELEGDKNIKISQQESHVKNVTNQTQEKELIIEHEEKSVPITMENKLQNVQSIISKKVVETSKDRLIPISYKGSFYNDSIFEDTKKSFEREAQEALNTFRGTIQVPETDNRVLQRAISTISDDATNYKVVLDVFGYEEHELKVQVSGENEISVEGISETNTGGTKTKKSFYRSFQLPCYVDLERTSTALSSEGILTVTIPKKNQIILKTENVTPITNQLNKASEEVTTLVVDVSGVVKDKKIEKKFDFGKVSNTNVTTTASTVSKQCNETREEVNLPTRIEEFSDTASVASVRDLQREESLASNVSSQTVVPMSTIDTMSLPIVPKGNFFDDNFFQDSRFMFENALRTTMNRFNRSSSFVDDVGFFKSLRQRRITDGGNQTATITEDEQITKIVLDVNGFDEKNLLIKFDGKNEITIEGNQEDKTNNSICKKRFRRSFYVSCGIDVKNVTSALSTDGILSIKVPKLNVKQLQN